MTLLESLKYKSLDEHDFNMYKSGYILFGPDNFNLIAYFHGFLKPETCQLQIDGLSPDILELYSDHETGPIDRVGIPHKEYIQRIHNIL